MSENFLYKTVKENNEILYPLGRNLFEDPKVVYHGTTSCFTVGIEQNGWRINDQPYDINDVKDICELSKELDYLSGGYAVLRPFTLGDSNSYIDDKRASFTKNYWMARGFASMLGGETIHALFECIKALKELVISKERFEDHIRYLRKEFDKYNHIINNIKKDDPHYLSIESNYIWFKTAIEKMNDVKFIHAISDKMQNLERKYHHFIDNVYGVVYALKIQPIWFKEWDDYPSKKTLTDFLAITDIEPSNIIARIDFPNGILPYTPAINNPLPLPWKMEVFKDFISSSMILRNSFLKKYLL